MKKASPKGNKDDLRPEYDLSQLKGGVRGKYYREATADTNLVRLLADTAQSATAKKAALRKSSNGRMKRSP